ncbi:hypothetical protein GBF38_012612, partial [Nibea albiflora]
CYHHHPGFHYPKSGAPGTSACYGLGSLRGIHRGTPRGYCLNRPPPLDHKWTRPAEMRNLRFSRRTHHLGRPPPPDHNFVRQPGRGKLQRSGRVTALSTLQRFGRDEGVEDESDKAGG